MQIAERQDGRPARYRHNESYVRWKRAESLVREHTSEELGERIDDRLASRLHGSERSVSTRFESGPASDSEFDCLRHHVGENAGGFY